MSGAWTRDDLSAFVRGRTIYIRDEHGDALPVPGWLAAHAAAVDTRNSTEAIATLHPDDRVTGINTFLESVASPGVPCAMQVRKKQGGVWGHHRGEWLNLLDDPDVGGVLYAQNQVEGSVVEPPELGDAGEHDAARWMILALDDAGSIAEVSGPAEASLGYTAEEMIGRPPTDFLHRDCVAESVTLWLDLRRTPGGTSSSRRRWIRKDGSEVWMESSYLNREHENAVTPVLVVVWDISERIAQERELDESRSGYRRLADEMRGLAADNEALARDFRLLADEVPSAVFRCDERGWVDFHNSRWQDVVPAGSDPMRLHQVVHDDDHAALESALREVSSGSGARRTIEVRQADGAGSWALTLRSVSAGDDERRAVVGSLDDVTDTVALRDRAERDPLTGLFNRSALLERLAAALADDRWATTVLFVDLDGFKSVNDTHGHDVGDAVLVELARRFGAAVRPGDDVCRVGGDEFVVVCRGFDHEDAPAGLVKRIASCLDEPIVVGDASWSPSASIGSAVPEPGEDAAAVLRRADLAMFEEKRRRGTAR
jgi:diguanylate cyclase (GGDEF)-like protein/PAS domain S-box-containing protein